jgi:phosphoribosylformylglycinamidine cyclo-ligase
MDAYTAAGVDISLGDKTTDLIKQHALTTYRPEVLSGVGFFGGMFEFKGYKKPVLVSSIDGVGTKVKLAAVLDRNDTVGVDLVNHCVNDILTGGAAPLFFLDYIAMGHLVPEQVAEVASGLARACREVDCVLIGGETAEMPGLYGNEDYDLVGVIIGVVEKDAIISGQKIQAGDALIGLPSSGLHTNGYSLARKIFGETRRTLDIIYPELGITIGDALMEPHRCYYLPLKPLLPRIRGMAHITGGGLIGNVPRILPHGLAARFNRGAWTVPPLFEIIQKKGKIDRDEMYRVFNMGIGMVVACAPEDASGLMEKLPEARLIGEVIEQTGDARVVMD